MTGISRRLPDRERSRLKLLKSVLPEGSGVIVRTAAEGASEEQIATTSGASPNNGRNSTKRRRPGMHLSCSTPNRISRPASSATSSTGLRFAHRVRRLRDLDD